MRHNTDWHGGESGSTTSRSDVLILGGGRFGSLAARRLVGRVLALAEVDPQPGLDQLSAPLWRMTAVAAALRALASPQTPAWIVPCVPQHFLAHWLLASLSEWQPRLLPVPEVLEAALPVLGWGPEGQIYLSLTNTLCPDDCPEPVEVCPKTGRTRGQPLFDCLAGLALAGWHNAVLRSHQLAPGVGGLAVCEMLALRQRLAGQGGRWLVATACRCHGVMHGLALACSATAATENNK